MVKFHIIRKHVGYTISWVLRASIIIMAFSYIYYQDFLAAILFMLMFVVSMIPIILNQYYNAKLHWTFDLFTSFMVFMHMSGFIGLYNIFPIWDDIAHLFGSCAITFIGFTFAYAMHESRRISITIPIMGLFAFFWTMGIGSIWEIIEFLWDNLVFLTQTYGLSQNGLIDTMIDLSWDMIAAVITAVGCVYFAKKSNLKRKDRIFGPFVKIMIARHINKRKKK